MKLVFPPKNSIVIKDNIIKQAQEHLKTNLCVKMVAFFEIMNDCIIYFLNLNWHYIHYLLCKAHNMSE